MAKGELRATTGIMTPEKVAEVFVGKPLCVTLDELARLRAQDAARVSPPSPPQQPSTPAVTALPPLACSAPAVPEGPCPVCPRLAVEFEPWRQAAFYKSMHDRALQREALLKQRVAELEAQLRLREQ